ncbi:bifunctional alpha,alpha-trehalose-phosphate synthase (UDP-forming)/trehalose-phosphatase [candidate division WOR-3 bacterium]|nr:bifunctional alpha,alpha-trehalose-phosphate synthase (UDP-forming)/trehalose-phosphatase [candidate division WOR-3 bacterium]
MSRLIIVSNRLPVSVTLEGRDFELRQSPGGLATGLGSVHGGRGSVWVGWPGTFVPTGDSRTRMRITRRLVESRCRPVFLSRSELDDYYRGFSNRTLWPLFHYFPTLAEPNWSFWRAYQMVNARFADRVAEIWREGDLIWVHDYHLMLLPGFLRRRVPHATVGFFLHIPFPSFEVFRLLPWRRELLEGVLGADVVGFHNYDYTRHFLSCARHILGFEHRFDRVAIDSRSVAVDAFPMGIDYERFNRPAASIARRRLETVTRVPARRRRRILSIDRLDYTKGIVERLDSYDAFLDLHPEYRGKIELVLLVVPSRTRVERYRDLREQIDRAVGRINGRYGGIDWTPVHYLYRSVPFERLVALYESADVALVTPLRDGMNLVSKEYVACQVDGHGVLVLSETAGAAEELAEALLVNPYDRLQNVAALAQALSMPEEEQVRRMRLMQDRLRRYDVRAWAADFIGRLRRCRQEQRREKDRRLAGPVRSRLIAAWSRARARLLLLDYDGTLVPFSAQPEAARPDLRLLSLLRRLSSPPGNELVIVSGRARKALDDWFGGLAAGLVAEHGAWVKCSGEDWQPAMRGQSQRWKESVRPVIQRFVVRTPGSEMEEKDFSLVWHYRRVGSELAVARLAELKDVLIELTANRRLEILEGSKVLEVRNAGTGKGRGIAPWLRRPGAGFVLAAGDDRTDEDLFGALPDRAWTVKVGPGPSQARFYVESPARLRALLERMARAT